MNDMNKKTQVVILGRNYSSLLGMIRSVGEAGCEVTVVRTVRKLPNKKSFKYIMEGAPIESKSKHVKKYMYAIAPKGKEMMEMICKEFEGTKENVILIPTDDFTASSIDLYQELLDEKFLFPNINKSSGAVVQMMDKEIQKKYAIEAELNVAQGWISQKDADGKYNIPEGIKYPVFTKPQISFLGNKKFMKRCNSEQELEALFVQIAKATEQIDCPILIEEFIEIEKEFGALGCAYNGTAIIPGIVEKLEIGHGAHEGVTLLGAVNSFDGLEELQEKLKKFVEKTGFHGLFDIDLYENQGKIYFNELNLRFGAFGYSITKAGVNLPEIFIGTLLGKDFPKVIPQVAHKKFVNDKVNLEDYHGGYVSWKEYHEIYAGADGRFVADTEDIGPLKQFKRIERHLRLKRVVKDILTKK